jgi:hypothetical protein
VPAPIPEEKRERIIELLGDGRTCSAIAAEVEVSTSTVSNVAKSIGHEFGQANLARAHESRSAYAAEVRAEIAQAAAERARRLLFDFEATQPVVAHGPDGSEVLDLALDARAQRDRASAIQVLTRTVLDIDRHDNRNDEGLAAVDAWLRDIVGKAAG